MNAEELRSTFDEILSQRTALNSNYHESICKYTQPPVDPTLTGLGRTTVVGAQPTKSERKGYN